MNYLPLAPPRRATPLRVLSIAGSDSGGGAGIQADMRTMALLGVHACVAVTAVTVQNTLGVKSFHEVPDDVVAGQMRSRGHRHRHPGRQDRDAGVVSHHRTRWPRRGAGSS